MNKPLALEILKHMVTCGPRLMIGALFVPHGQSLRSVVWKAEKEAARCPHDFSNHSRATVSVTLNRMKKQKLVLVSGSKKKAIWSITQKGKDHFKKVENSENITELPKEDGKTRIVMFDIPEHRKVERNWLRRELLSCDYSPLQKSVFMGIRPLPRKFLEEIESRGLLSNVHVVGLENS